MAIIKLSSLLVTGILLGSTASLALADESTRYSNEVLEQQRNEAHFNNQGEDSQIRNRFNESSGKGEMTRQRNMDGSSTGSQFKKGMGGSKSKGK